MVICLLQCFVKKLPDKAGGFLVGLFSCLEISKRITHKGKETMALQSCSFRRLIQVFGNAVLNSSVELTAQN